MLSPLALFALVAVFVGGSYGNECPKIVTQKPFDLSKYVGLWYEIWRTNVIFQVGNKCVNATYTGNADGSIGVFNQAINGLGAYTSIRGFAKVKDPSDPAALSVVFDNPNQAGDYNVIATDYNQYALVYSCRKIPTVATKFESAWILSRTKTLPEPVVKQLKQSLSALGGDAAGLIETPQNC